MHVCHRYTCSTRGRPGRFLPGTAVSGAAALAWLNFLSPLRTSQYPSSTQPVLLLTLPLNQESRACASPTHLLPSLPRAPLLLQARVAASAAHPRAMADELDELLTGRRLSPAKRAAYFGYALSAVLPAALLFVQIFVVDVARSRLTIGAGVAATAAVLSVAYHNLCAAHAERIRAAATPPTKAAYKGKKTDFDAALARHDAKVESCALAYSVFYNNALFLCVAPFVGCYICAGKFGGDLNFLLSSTAAAGLALFNSHSALKAMSS